MSELVTTIKKILADADLVLGWTVDEATGVGTPARFYSEADAEAAIFDSTCVHNLAVHLPRLKDKTVGIVAKGCDARSVVELIIEHETVRDRVKVIGVGCDSMLDVKKIWRRFGYGAPINDDGSILEIGGERVDRDEFLQRKCHGCQDADESIYDVIIGETATGAPAGDPEPHPLKEHFDSLSSAQRREFWRQQFARCIRCYACREICPMCFCRDVCTMQTQVPHWAGGEVNPLEAEMIQHIRLSHMAGRCTDCCECERACPVGIPLMLLFDEQNRAIEEMFNYRAGSDLEARPPMQIFSIDEDRWSKG